MLSPYRHGFIKLTTFTDKHGWEEIRKSGAIRVLLYRCLQKIVEAPISTLLIVMTLLAACGQVPDPEAAEAATATPLAFAVYENETALDLIYPADWEHIVVTEGLLLFGEPETVGLQETGASVTVLRLAAGSAGANLQETFDHYIENGPLQSGYQTVTETETGTLGGRDALEIFVEKSQLDEQPAMRAFITSAQTESGATYILAASAPQADWEEQWRAFQVLLQSVEFNE